MKDLVFDDSVRTFLTWWGWVPWVPEIVGSPLMLGCRGEEWLLSCKPVRACRSRQRGMIRTAAWRWLMVGCWSQRCLVGRGSCFWRRTLGGTQLPNFQRSPRHMRWMLSHGLNVMFDESEKKVTSTQVMKSFLRCFSFLVLKKQNP